MENKNNSVTAFIRKLGIKHVIFALTMIAMIFVPFFANNYVLKIFQSAAINMIFGMSLNLLMGIGGTVSFGHACFYGVGAYTSACMWFHFGWTSAAAFPLVILFSAIAGLLLAIPMSRITGRYVTIITLSYAEILNLIMRNWTKVTNGVMGILNIPNFNLFGYELKYKDEQYWLILVFVVITYIMINWLVNSK
ncbi:MAG: branched-chain amino acid ABC transporter permease, partial [Erysipelotrichaceae bacterium]|nr:branched-chain amino acid ABC transporter permease [Erysipelotrichaceae bacterium]